MSLTTLELCQALIRRDSISPADKGCQALLCRELEALGFVIEHNPGNATAKGSCIFAHLWATLGQTTAGCTAMNERQMRDLLAWLEQGKRPVFALLPYAEYRRLQVEWDLPGEVASPK